MRDHPPYHLRPNKAVDRLTFLESIRLLDKVASLKDYTYYGFGGPHLEEFRLLYEFCPEIPMVSIEEDSDTFKRQKFHIPCSNLNLEHRTFKTFLVNFVPVKKSIFWLDYINLKFAYFDEFRALLPKVGENSMIKISVRAEHWEYQDAEKEEEFKTQFRDIMPDSSISLPRTADLFASLLKDMFQIVSQRALIGTGLRFQPISCFYYDDNTGMFTLTGIVCKKGNNGEEVRNAYASWEFASLSWRNKPKQIDLPILSTKERLYLQEFLPCSSVRKLFGKLGYRVGKSKKNHRNLIKQYVQFHRYFPYFMKASP